MGTPSLAAAFVKAQKAFAPALKTSTNPAFKSKYADLASCISAVIDALNANGLGLVQIPNHADGVVSVETVLIHESGEERSFGSFAIPVTKQDAHGTMSALTYCRRGSLMAAMGIAPEDDDGNASIKPVQAKAMAVPTASVPAGYSAWVDDLTAVADTGYEALAKSFKGSPEPFRVHLSTHEPELLARLKARAKKIDDGKAVSA